MEMTATLLAKRLGATGIEGAGGDARFEVQGAHGGRLKVSLSARQQRFMGVLSDASGVVRCTVDVAPIAHVTEDNDFPGRVTLHVGKTLIHVDSVPDIAIEMVSIVD